MCFVWLFVCLFVSFLVFVVVVEFDSRTERTQTSYGKRYIKECMGNFKLIPKRTEMQTN